MDDMCLKAALYTPCPDLLILPKRRCLNTSKISDTVVCIDGNKVGRIGTPEDVFKGDYIQKLYKIPAECFDPVLGILNLKGNKADPKVFVIGGAGQGIAIYQKLQRENIPFAAGILSRNDVEFSTANALGKVIYTEAFYPIGAR